MPRSRPLGQEWIFLPIMMLVLTFPMGALGGEGPGLQDRITKQARDYQTQMMLIRAEQSLGLSLGTAGETWSMAALDLTERMKRDGAHTFMTAVLKAYHDNLSRTVDPTGRALAGLNLFYQSVDTMVVMLAMAHQDEAALKSIKEAEERTGQIVSQASSGPPALAALSGGLVTMLALLAAQVDRQGNLGQILSAEVEQRRGVDTNIAALKNEPAERRLQLLINNHLQGALSMIQIIGLARNPELKPRLAQVEMELLKSRESAVEAQITAAARAVAEAGFIVIPTFAQL